MRKSGIATVLIVLVSLSGLFAQDAPVPSTSNAPADPAAATAPAPTDPAAAPPAAPAAPDPAAELEAARARVAELEARIATLEEEIAAFGDERAALDGTIAGLEEDLEGRADRISELEELLASFEESGVEAQLRIAELEAERDGLEAAVEEEAAARAEDAESAEAIQDDLFAAIETAQAERDVLEARVEELELELAARQAGAEAARATWGMDGRIDYGLFTETLATGFAGAKPRLGTWKITGDRALQTDAKQFFARLELPLAQEEGRAYLYRFTARSAGSGWVGLGIHLFASNVKSRKGYGEGRSLLVWLTRDQAVRKTDATWLQLYRSFDDVNMERVVDAKIPEAVAGEHLVEVVYDPSTGYILVALDGRISVVYRTFFGVDEGLGVSLRTLGAGAEFSGYEVLSTAP